MRSKIPVSTLVLVHTPELVVLLIERADFPGLWQSVTGSQETGESLAETATRELMEETGVSGVYLEQLYTFGSPDRDPRERIISVAYYGLTPVPAVEPRAGSDAARAIWFVVDQLPELAFDHADIIAKARERLRAKLDYSTIAFQFMPRKFTLSELQVVYQTILGEALDKRNFRKRINAQGLVKPTGDQRRDGKHRPAALYRASHPNRVDYIK